MRKQVLIKKSNHSIVKQKIKDIINIIYSK